MRPSKMSCTECVARTGYRHVINSRSSLSRSCDKATRRTISCHPGGRSITPGRSEESLRGRATRKCPATRSIHQQQSMANHHLGFRLGDGRCCRNSLRKRLPRPGQGCNKARNHFDDIHNHHGIPSRAVRPQPSEFQNLSRPCGRGRASLSSVAPGSGGRRTANREVLSPLQERITKPLPRPSDAIHVFAWPPSPDRSKPHSARATRPWSSTCAAKLRELTRDIPDLSSLRVPG